MFSFQRVSSTGNEHIPNPKARQLYGVHLRQYPLHLVYSRDASERHTLAGSYGLICGDALLAVIGFREIPVPHAGRRKVLRMRVRVVFPARIEQPPASVLVNPHASSVRSRALEKMRVRATVRPNGSLRVPCPVLSAHDAPRDLQFEPVHKVPAVLSRRPADRIVLAAYARAQHSGDEQGHGEQRQPSEDDIHDCPLHPTIPMTATMMTATTHMCCSIALISSP